MMWLVHQAAHLDRHIRWNDMAVITHDNAAVRPFGERLRRDGVPVRYLFLVTRPLKDETFVQGLFALVELARLRAEGMAECQMTLKLPARHIRMRAATLMNGLFGECRGQTWSGASRKACADPIGHWSSELLAPPPRMMPC